MRASVSVMYVLRLGSCEVQFATLTEAKVHVTTTHIVYACVGEGGKTGLKE